MSHMSQLLKLIISLAASRLAQLTARTPLKRPRFVSFQVHEPAAVARPQAAAECRRFAGCEQRGPGQAGREAS